MKKSDGPHLVPALVFGGILAIMLIASGASPTDALLALCAAYALVSLLELVFSLDSSTSAEHKP